MVQALRTALAIGIGSLALAPHAAADPYAQEWPQFGRTPVHSGYNPFEHHFTIQNIATLGQAWTGAYGPNAADEASPVIAGGVAYITGFDGRLSAFNLAGCFGARCDPLWTGQTDNDITAAPAVWKGSVFVASADRYLYAFPAGGCNFNPTCEPLWKGHMTGAVVSSSPVVSDGVVYVGTYNHGLLYAFRAGGCGNALCEPLWVGKAGGHLVAPPAADHQHVFIGSDNGRFYAFEAGGCNAPVCQPSWKAFLGGPDDRGAPTIDGDTVYIESTRLNALPANGCGHDFCKARWWGDLGDEGGETTPAIWRGFVITATQVTPTPGANVGVVQAWQAGGCGKHLCQPIWTGVNFASGFESSPAIANGIIFVAKGPASGFPVDVGLYAYRARGCGSDICSPISFAQATIDGNYLGSTPAVADGMIVFGANDNTTGQGTLYAFMP